MLAPLRDDVRAPSRWPALDGIRGVALWTVIGYHAYRIVLAGPAELDVAVPIWAWPFGLAKFAIDVFFVLSGFLVIASWEAARRRAISTAAAARTYVARRLFRVAPAWWLSLAVLIPLRSPELLQPERWGDLVLFGTAQQYVRSGLASTVNTPSWSLTVELQFYAAVPLVAWGMRRAGRWPMAAGTLALSCVWWLWLRRYVPLPPSSLPGRIDQFTLGAVAGSLVMDHERGRLSRLVLALRRRWVPIAAVVVLMALGTHHGSTLGVTSGSLLDALLHPIAGVLIAVLLVALLTSGRRTVLDRPFPRASGLVSYSGYLWHYPLLLAVLRWSGHAGTGRFDAGLVLVLGAYLALLSGLAVAGYSLAERPFLHRRSHDSSGEVVAGAVVGAAPAVSR